VQDPSLKHYPLPGDWARAIADAQARMRRYERAVQPDPAEHTFSRRFVDEVHAPAYPQLRPVHEAGRQLAGGAARPNG
jgi:hypothetical protein